MNEPDICMTCGCVNGGHFNCHTDLYSQLASAKKDLETERAKVADLKRYGYNGPVIEDLKKERKDLHEELDRWRMDCFAYQGRCDEQKKELEEAKTELAQIRTIVDAYETNNQAYGMAEILRRLAFREKTK